MHGTDEVFFLLLAATSITYSIAIRRVEHLRRALAAEKTPNLLSVWTFAATLLLPPPLIAGVVVIAYAAQWPSQEVRDRTRLFKYAYSGLAAIAACLTASAVVDRVPAAIGIALAALAASTVNVALIAVALVAARETPQLRKFTNAKAHVAELATQALGVALAGLMSWHVALGVLVVPLLLLVHRWSLRETVKVEKAFDKETGLWSATAWRIQAQQMLYDAHGHVALIIIDPDGSGSDRQILDAIGSGLKSADLIGRYGSRQIVVLIPVGRREAGLFLSTGFRADLARAGVNAPLGCATTADGELEGLLIDAMSDLMARRAAAGVDHAW
ncbi:MAG: hypothetical protein JO144_10795 [Actinobacteria bacterium]|nr:hypothetical protein [Actinomycetota bacterium]